MWRKDMESVIDVYKRQIRTRSYDDQTGAKRYVTEIFVDSMEMLSPRGTTAPGLSLIHILFGQYNRLIHRISLSYQHSED